MKKLYLAMVFIAFCGGAVSGDADKQEEIDFLLFLPNSSNQFTDESQAMIHLDAVTNYLKGRDILPGQIYVYGYAANVVNDIEPIRLSMNRALFVIQELQKRGITSDLFADPVGYGPVDLWGNNTDEADRSPNRRVRILVNDIILTPAIVAAEPTAAIPLEEPIRHDDVTEKSGFSFPWWLLLLALLAIAAIIFFASKRTKNTPGKPLPATVPVQEAVPPKVIPVASKEKIKILEEEEIRRYAYELYERRNGQNGDTVGDWHQSICELTVHYEVLGYRVILYWKQEARQYSTA